MPSKGKVGMSARFDPTNDDGSISKNGLVRTGADFALFTKWLSAADKGTVARRKAAYERVAGGGAGSAKPEHKAAFLDAVCGAYLRSSMEEANEAARNPDDMSDADRALVDGCRHSLSLFFQAVAQEFFEGQLLTCKEMSKKAVDMIVQEFLADEKSVSGAILHAARAVGKSPAEAIVEWIENPENAASFTSRESPLSGDEKRALGRFAPLVDAMLSEASPSVRAESIAVLLTYAKSGWLERDLRGGDLHPSDKADRQRTANLQAWRSAVENPIEESLRAKKTQERLLCDALRERVADLLVPLEVKDDPSDASGFRAVVNARDAKFRDGIFNNTAPRGVVDVAMLTPNGDLVVAFATSDASMSRQDDQAARHSCAVRRLVEEGFSGALAALNNDGKRNSKPSCSFLYLTTALALPAGYSSVQRGGAIEGVLAPGAVLDKSLCDIINVVPFLSTALSRVATMSPSQAMDVELFIGGWNASAYSSLRDVARTADRQVADLRALNLMSFFYKSAWERLAESGFGEDIILMKAGGVGGKAHDLLSAMSTGMTNLTAACEFFFDDAARRIGKPGGAFDQSASECESICKNLKAAYEVSDSFALRMAKGNSDSTIRNSLRATSLINALAEWEVTKAKLDAHKTLQKQNERLDPKKPSR